MNLADLSQNTLDFSLRRLLSQILGTSCLDLALNGVDLNSFSLLHLVLGEPFQVLESTLVFSFFFGVLEILGHLEEDYPYPLFSLNNSLQLLVDLTSFSHVGLVLYKIGRELLELVTGLC